MPETPYLEETCRTISRLALADRPGAIVLAEQAVDQHIALFCEPADQLTALDALARDLIRLGRARPELSSFLQRVDDYIELVQHPLATAEVAEARATPQV